MSQQKAVSLSSHAPQIEEEGAEEFSEEEQQGTRAALLGYVFQRATVDGGLSRDQARTFQNAQRETRTLGDAAVVGQRLAQIGDEIDAQYHDEMEEIVQLTGSPETAFSIFFDIVKNLFEWDESGGARINVGRIAALLAYCYHLCKTYIQSNLSTYGLLTFLGTVSAWLFKFLLKAKFYDWLSKQGGWGRMLSTTTSGWGQHAFLVIGVTSILIWAYSYFRGR